MLGRDHRAEIGLRVERIARDQRPRPFTDERDVFLLPAPGDDLAHVGGTVLAAVPESGGHRMLDNLWRQIGIVQDDEGALATHLESDALEVAIGCITQKQAPDLRRAGKGHRIHVRVQAQRLAGRLAETRNNVKYTVRQACFRRQLREFEDRERGLLGWFDHDGTAAGQRGAKLPGGHEQRKIPGQDDADHPDRLMGDQGERILASWSDLAEALVDQLGIPLQRARHLGADLLQTVPDRFPAVEAFENRQVGGMGPDQFGELQKHGLALFGRRPRPRTIAESPARRCDGAINIRRLAAGDCGEHLARRRVRGFHRLAPSRRGETPAMKARPSKASRAATE